MKVIEGHYFGKEVAQEQVRGKQISMETGFWKSITGTGFWQSNTRTGFR
jgi:hypothetical protein